MEKEEEKIKKEYDRWIRGIVNKYHVIEQSPGSKRLIVDVELFDLLWSYRMTLLENIIGYSDIKNKLLELEEKQSSLEKKQEKLNKEVKWKS